jgi:hypothetical protein
MRSTLLSYLTANLTGSIKVSQELPFEEGNNPLYLKNMKRVYVDEPITETDRLHAGLDGLEISQKITKIRAYLAVDAKNRNTDLDSALSILEQAKNQLTDSFRKEFDYTTTINGSTMTFEFEYRAYNLA